MNISENIIQNEEIGENCQIHTSIVVSIEGPKNKLFNDDSTTSSTLVRISRFR